MIIMARCGCQFWSPPDTRDWTPEMLARIREHENGLKVCKLCP